MLNKVVTLLGCTAIVLVSSCVIADCQDQGNQAVGPMSSATTQVSNEGVPENRGHPALQRRDPRYTVRKGDVLDLNFPFTPEFNQTVTVQPDGYITLRGAGDLRVEGQTTPQLVEQVRTAYGGSLHDPVVTVDVKDFEKPYFIVSGEVEHPGKFDLRGDTTVTQAVAIAGGFTSSAKHSQVLLFRPVSDEWVEVKKINVKKMLRSADLSEDVHLRPGDMLFAPKNSLSKIAPFIPRPGLGLWLNPLR